MTDLGKIFPPVLEHWIETRIADGLYIDVGDYIRHLIRRDKERDAAAYWNWKEQCR